MRCITTNIKYIQILEGNTAQKFVTSCFELLWLQEKITPCLSWYKILFVNIESFRQDEKGLSWIKASCDNFVENLEARTNRKTIQFETFLNENTKLTFFEQATLFSTYIRQNAIGSRSSNVSKHPYLYRFSTSLEIFYIVHKNGFNIAPFYGRDYCKRPRLPLDRVIANQGVQFQKNSWKYSPVIDQNQPTRHNGTRFRLQ